MVPFGLVVGCWLEQNTDHKLTNQREEIQVSYCRGLSTALYARYSTGVRKVSLAWVLAWLPLVGLGDTRSDGRC